MENALKVYKCIIWGTGKYYTNRYNALQLEVSKKNIEIIAFVSNNQYVKQIDEYMVVDKSEIEKLDFDYVIVMSNTFFDEIVKQIEELQINRNRVLSGQVFDISCFDFKRYINLIENPVTIILDDCWGGIIYNHLHLQFSSPFINILWNPYTYMRLLENLNEYLNSPLIKKRDADTAGCQWPVGILGEGNNAIEVDFIHSRSFEEAKNEWERRKESINVDNILVKMTLQGEKSDLLDRFMKLPFENKYCFYTSKTNLEEVIYLPRFQQYLTEREYVEEYNFYSYVRKKEMMYTSLDLLKLLNHESDFRREY